MFKNKIHLITSLFILVNVVPPLVAGQYFCLVNSATYNNQSLCDTACGSACQVQVQKTTGASGTCDTTKYDNFVYHNNKTYALSKTPGFWENTINLAQSKNIAENNVLQSIANGQSAWIGLSDPLKSTSFNAVDSSRFMYKDGSKPTSFSKWANGQPDNKLDNADVGVTSINGEHWVYMQNGEWYDDGYHSSYGGTFQPQKKSIVEWNGVLDCVNSTPPKDAASNKTGYWCSSSEGTVEQCVIVNTSATPTCSSGVWNSSSKMCESVVPATQSDGLPTSGMIFVLYYVFSNQQLYKNQQPYLVGTMIVFRQDDFIVRRLYAPTSNGCSQASPLNYQNINLTHYAGANIGTIHYKNVSDLWWNKDTKQLRTATNRVIDFKNKTSTDSEFRFVNGSFTAVPPPTSVIRTTLYEQGRQFYDGSFTAPFDYSLPDTPYWQYLKAGTIDPGGAEIAWGSYLPASSSCPTGYGNIAYTTASLPAGSSCPTGSTPSGSNCITSSIGSCPSGSNLTNGECTSTTQSCPLGNYPCVDIAGGVTSEEETTQGTDDKTDNGEKDANGGCLDQIYIFSGKDNRCRKAGMQTGGTDCCKKGESWFGLAQCKTDEKLLGTLRKWGELDGQCHYVGSYCHEKWPVGGCVQTKKTYCCFSSPLARIINEGGRPQLGLGWGVPKTPDCRGFTPDEFQKIDFSKVDFSEWIRLEVIPGVQAGAVGNISNTVNNISKNF